MKKTLFFIHDLGHGGAEKVLVNLVNNIDTAKFDITVMTLFDEGINRQYLSNSITYKSCFKKAIRGNSHLMKLLSPRQLHRWLIKDRYDIEIAYLEGPCARVISGCTDANTRKVGWIHIEQRNRKRAAVSFRSYEEAMTCYNALDKIICVSNTVREDFLSLLPVSVPTEVLYNTNESAKILEMAQETVESGLFSEGKIKLVGVGKLLKSKGFHRLISIVHRLHSEGFPVHLYILGTGPMERELQKQISACGAENFATLLGYQTNPYKYVAKCDLFVCASHAEGFSTAATEALIVGTPVCTVEVSGMKEMLGEHDEYGIVTENSEEALYQGIRHLLEDPAQLAHYKQKAAQRGRTFSTAETVQAVERMLLNL